MTFKEGQFSPSDENQGVASQSDFTPEEEKLVMKFFERIPETEREYFEMIECLGATKYYLITKHNIESDRRLRGYVLRICRLSNILVRKLEKFGVIHPDDYPQLGEGEELPPAPEGKIYYWDWYRMMKYGEQKK